MLTLKFALRSFARTPFVTAVAIASLALGIGANTAIFTMFNQLLLRPLPVSEPDQLVNLAAPGPKPGSTSCNEAGDCEQVFSYPMFRDLEREQTVFTGIAMHRSFGANLAIDGETVNGEAAFVSGSYFPLLGVQPALGRLIGPGDDKAPGESPVVVLGYGYWQTHLAGRPDVLGRSIIVNGEPLTIVGVTPDGFDGTTLGSRPYAYVPVTLSDTLDHAPGRLENRRSHWTYLFARLKPGTTIEQARAAINVPYHAILNDVEAPLQTGMSDQTMARFRARSVVVEPGSHGQSSVNTMAVTPLSLLLGVTAFVLLIACANVANLLLARAAARRTEIAVRLAIGASRWQLARQLLFESCLLAAAGGLLGLPVAWATLQGIVAILPAEATSTMTFHMDWHVMVFAAAVALGTGFVFGLFPAWQGTRPDLIASIKNQAGQSSGARAAARFRWVLATGQIALSMALLASAGFFVKSLVNVSRVSLGITPENVVTFGVSPELNGYPPARSRQVFDEIRDALLAMPGVTGVTTSSLQILASNSWGANVRVEGFDAGPDTDTSSRRNEVGTDYFRVLQTPLLAGRDFTAADALGAPKVAIVNETFARKFNLANPVGRHIGIGHDANQALDVEIVGLMHDARYADVKDDVPPVFFTPARQDDALGNLYFYVRTARGADEFLASVPKVVAGVDRTLPVQDLRTLPQQVRDNIFLDRFVTLLSAAFAALATLLAAIGLYGVLAYTVAQRTREIGVRMALGAEPGRVRGMVLRQVAVMTAIGGAAGLAAAVGIGTLAGSLLYRLRGSDPAVLALSAAALALVALGAGYLPARRASRIDPIRALRYE